QFSGLSLMYLLDTNSCVFLFTGTHPILIERVAACGSGELALSTIVLAELALGSANGKIPPTELLEAFLEEVVLLPFDEAAACAYAQMPFRRGRFDRLLAAHALSVNATVVTNNPSDFTDILGLKVEDWTW
ncbi:type II toxin-antitoxin system VapC family toxin, partial [Sphingobium sp.]|uniref:type II toxin-antitoxin system VapC family toxin n=1 Tax=Sphingobium sp. TaxID=1912891 RepID=UPI002CE3F315